MNFKILQCLFSLILSLNVSSISGDQKTPQETLFSNTFETKTDFLLWTKWSPSEHGAISQSKPGNNSKAAALFTVPTGGWNTPIVTFSLPIAVAENTIVEFDINADSGGALNIRNSSDGGEYSLSFKITPRKWCTVRRYLKYALYKREGDPEKDKDGLLGDKISQIQIVCAGKNVWIDNFKIYNSNSEVRGIPDMPEVNIKPELEKYDILDKVFPYGPIIVVSGERANSNYFDQPFKERFEDQLADIKRHYCNTVSNFCDDNNFEYRLDMMAKFNLYLVETFYSHLNFSGRPLNDQYVQKVLQHKDNENLLVWYGLDEPSDVEAYINNKIAVTKLDTKHPYASAFCDAHAIQQVGKYLELIMIDPYLIKSNAPVSATPGQNIMSYIAQTRKSMPVGKIWLIAQTYSLRHENLPALRYPTPEEFRFGAYTAIAAGAKGLLFFIYNDAVGYLDGSIRGEEYDKTLVDAWGNDNPTYQELAKVGKKLLPIMPSLLDSSVVEKSKLISSADTKQVVIGELEGQAGRVIVVVSKNPTASIKVPLKVSLAKGQKLYSLFTLEELPNSAELEFAPLDGQMLIVTTPEKFEVLQTQIAARALKQEVELTQLDVMALKKAGFDVDKISDSLNSEKMTERSLQIIREEFEKVENSNPKYVAAKQGLFNARHLFGDINSIINTQIRTLDATKDSQWLSIFEKSKKLSNKYFKMLSALQHGDLPDPKQIENLNREIKSLKVTVINMLASKNKLKHILDT